MKKKTIFLLSAALAVLLAGGAAVLFFLNSGSAVQQNDCEKALLGKWAYIHDKATKAASFRSNGRAEFEGKKYKYSADGQYILFTGSDGETLRLRYLQDGDQMYLYIRSKYVPMSGYSTDGITGVWICEEKNWTFEFTDKGTFLEDAVLTGHYYTDEENGMMKLAYEEVLEDTDLYYELAGEELWIEYPWLMLKM